VEGKKQTEAGQRPRVCKGGMRRKKQHCAKHPRKPKSYHRKMNMRRRWSQGGQKEEPGKRELKEKGVWLGLAGDMSHDSGKGKCAEDTD